MAVTECAWADLAHQRRKLEAYVELVQDDPTGLQTAIDALESYLVAVSTPKSA